jgi:WD40 repeat protein
MPQATGLSRYAPLPAAASSATGSSEAKPVFHLKVDGGIESLAFSPNRHFMIAGSADGTARIWNITGSMPAECAFLRLDAAVRAVAFASNSRNLAAASASGVVKTFELTSNGLRDGVLLRGSKASIDALAYSSDCMLLAGGGADQTLRLWEPGKGIGAEPKSQIPGHMQAIHTIAFAADGTSIATGSADATARIWALNRIRPGQLSSLPHAGDVVTVSFAPDGRTVATSGKDQVIWLWDVTATKPTVRARLDGHSEGTRLVHFTGDGETVVSVGANDVKNWSPRSGRLRAEWSLPNGTATRFALTADGRYLARGTSSGSIELFRVADKRK